MFLYISLDIVAMHSNSTFTCTAAAIQRSFFIRQQCPGSSSWFTLFFAPTSRAYFNFNLKYLKIGAISFVLCMQSSVWAVILLPGSAVDSKLHFRSSMKMMGFLIRLLNVFLNDHFYYFFIYIIIGLAAFTRLLGVWFWITNDCFVVWNICILNVSPLKRLHHLNTAYSG